MWKSPLYNTTKLTLELRDVIAGGVDIWDFEYPSYYKGDEKTAIEQKVIDHYYLRQIGQETVGRFLHVFRTKIREIMPYYVDMYKTVEIMNGIEDPFGNLDVTETFHEETTGTGSASGNSTTIGEGSSNHIFSNTPQGTISNIERYMSEASKDSSESSGSAETSSESETTGTIDRTFTRKGNHGVNTYAHDMIEFRKSIINVDMMIINELNSLFLGVY